MEQPEIAPHLVLRNDLNSTTSEDNHDYLGAGHRSASVGPATQCDIYGGKIGGLIFTIIRTSSIWQSSNVMQKRIISTTDQFEM